MKYMHKAQWQPDGNLVIRGNSRALLYRAVEDLRAALEAAYGPQRVAEWEAQAAARLDAKKAYREALMRKNGQVK